MHQQQQRNDSMDGKQRFEIGYGLCAMHQRAIVILCRKRFGSEALGLPCFFALVLMFLWGGFTGDPFLWLYMVIWLLCFIQRRIESVKLRNAGERIHSFYDGLPFDAMRYCKDEKTAKLVVEPLLVAILGGIVYAIYESQGWSVKGLPYFLMAGVFTLPLVELVKQTIWQKRTQAMMDARLEQEATMRDFHDRYGKY